MTPLLAAQSVALLRGDRLLFRDLSFALAPGDALCIEGANGSGKTSLLRVLAGLLEADEGDVRWQGTPISSLRQEYCSELVWLGHLGGAKRDLTLEENLQFECALRPRNDTGLSSVIERVGLKDLTRLPLRALSAGQQRRVALARLLLSAARLWLLDEPFTNLDRHGQTLVGELLREHLSAGGIAVMATHKSAGPDLLSQRLVLQ
ncbi:MAG: cytochrome c biogenesis heme-transporting ATPase CcmA [Woeseia sp.]|nr:cytochrome c biogenesis heme-transporting ATPase CcmA [Woeseia sp.]NNL56061.1 cytochrome c biogenesis heme-transporting ATPase CcmA [Woeseia sp.]